MTSQLYKQNIKQYIKNTTGLDDLWSEPVNQTSIDFVTEDSEKSKKKPIGHAANMNMGHY